MSQPSIEPIAVGLALRADDAAPLMLGRELSRFTGAPLALVHVFPYDPLTPLPAPEYAERERTQALIALARLAEPLIDEIDVTLHVEANPSAARGLHDAAATLGASLLVVGSSHRGRVGLTMPGGVGERLIHATPCAIAVAPRGYRPSGRGFGHIGVAFADSPEGREALSAAMIIARIGGAKLSVYTVLEPHRPIAPATMAPDWVPPAEWSQPKRERARAIAEDAVAGGPSGLVEGIVVLEGDPAQALAQASSGVDLLVCGSRGYGPVRTALLGSVSARLAHSCAAPLLVLPREKAAVPATASPEVTA